jgi:sarcosine oxidase subunit alpha
MENLRVDSVNRNRKVFINVNGKKISAYEGETLLAVLIASGVRILKKSAILQEPRGGLCGMGVCYDCLVTVDGVPNIRSCMTYVKNGMEIKTDE